MSRPRPERVRCLTILFLYSRRARLGISAPWRSLRLCCARFADLCFGARSEVDSAELRVGFINRVLDLRFLPQGLKSVRENSSFAPLELDHFRLVPTVYEAAEKLFWYPAIHLSG